MSKKHIYKWAFTSIRVSPRRYLVIGSASGTLAGAITLSRPVTKKRAKLLIAACYKDNSTMPIYEVDYARPWARSNRRELS